MRRALTSLFVAIAAIAVLHAQAPAPAPAFEAATIKPSDPTTPGQFVRRQPGGRFSTSNMPLRELVRFAYQVQDFQLEGVPAWASTERYDIIAKAEGDPPPVLPGTGPDQLMLMLRTLLAERFQLKLHNETKEMPIYALVRLRPDRLGPRLEQSTVDCVTLIQSMQAAARAGGPAPTPPPPDASGRPTCGIRGGFGSLAGNGFPLNQLSATLSQMVRRTVIDRTGLSGTWAFDLKFTPDAGQLPPGASPNGPDAPVIDPNGPSIFTAVQEQLGLKLDATRGPVEMLIVDRLERPTPD